MRHLPVKRCSTMVCLTAVSLRLRPDDDSHIFLRTREYISFVRPAIRVYYVSNLPLTIIRVMSLINIRAFDKYPCL